MKPRKAARRLYMRRKCSQLAPVTELFQPDEEMVCMCEGLLERARAGVLLGCAFVTDVRNLGGGSGYRMIGDGSRANLLMGLEYLRDRLLYSINEATGDDPVFPA